MVMNTLGLSDVLLRLGLALVAGLIIGSERESHGRAAGLRTTSLVCIASAVAMILSDYLFRNVAGPTWRPDPARLAAGILTGIGFIGAGTIIRHENVVRGVTTAAVLWLVTLLGLAFGSGYLALGLVGLAVALLILFLLPVVERYVQNDWYGTVSITTQMNGPHADEIRRRIETIGGKVKKMNLDYHLQARRKTFHCEIKFKKGQLFELSQQIVRQLSECPDVTRVKWQS
jgi:putative Mg2+ transporter-C (MgtC) family protein